MEQLTRTLTLILTAWAVVMVPVLWKLWGDYDRLGIPIHPSYFAWVIPGFIGCRVLYLVCIHIFAARLRPYIIDWGKELQDEKAMADEDAVLKLGNCIFGTIYYLCSAGVLTWLSIRDGLLPTQLFGPQDPDTYCTDWPMRPSHALQVCYMLALGHHLERVFYEFKDNYDATTFYTMLFHHVLTVVLIAVSFFTFLHKWGIFILLTHDFTDIILYVGRTMRCLIRSKVPTTIILVLMFLSWVTLRFVTYFRVVIIPIYACYSSPDSSFRRFFLANTLFVPALTSLFLLNTFWIFQILKIAYMRLSRREKQVTYVEKLTQKFKNE